MWEIVKMENQIKLLNKEYLEHRIKELKEIKDGSICFSIQESYRVFSRTVYINFFCQNLNVDGRWRWYKRYTVRISDHKQPNCLFPQVIINPQEKLTKSKKAEFTNVLKLAIKRAKIKSLYRSIDKLSKK